MLHPGSDGEGKGRKGKAWHSWAHKDAPELWLWQQRLSRVVPLREIIILVLTPRISKQDVLPVAVNGCEGHRSDPPELNVSGEKGRTLENCWKCVRLYFVTGNTPKTAAVY